MIDAVILIFVLFNFGGLQLQPFPLFGEFPNVVSRDHAYADRRKGGPKMLHIFRNSLIYSRSDMSDIVYYSETYLSNGRRYQ